MSPKASRRWAGLWTGLLVGGRAAIAQEVDPAAFTPKLDLGMYWKGSRLESPLNPGNFTGQVERTWNVDARVGVAFDGGEVLARLASQRTRPVQTGNGDGAKLLRAHVTVESSDSISWAMGKKNLHFDSGFAFHPLDFFEDLSVAGDFGQWAAAEEGFPLVAVAHRWSWATVRGVYSSDSMTESLPYNRGLKQGLLSLETTGDSWDASLLLQKYGGSSVGLGTAASWAVSDGLSLNAGAFTRKGSLRPTYGSAGQPHTSLVPESDRSMGRWRIDDSRWFTKVLLGGHYTFASNIDVLVEYFFDGEGVSDGDWQRFLGHIAAVELLPDGALKQGARANGLRSLSTRRRRYAFGRVQFNDLAMRPEVSVLAGEGRGGQLNFKIHHLLPQDVLLWAHYSRNYGPASSEFGLFPASRSLSLGARWRY